MSNNTVELKDKGLQQILKALKGPFPVAKIGIIGGNSIRTNASSSNAEIGAKHEFGLDGMPIRSFLRQPLTEQLQSYLAKAGAFDEDALRRVVASGSLEEWTKKVATIAETVILEAFATGGFGKWKPSNMALKKVQQTLVETGQLRDSISSEVK